MVKIGVNKTTKKRLDCIKNEIDGKDYNDVVNNLIMSRKMLGILRDGMRDLIGACGLAKDCADYIKKGRIACSNCEFMGWGYDMGVKK